MTVSVRPCELLVHIEALNQESVLGVSDRPVLVGGGSCSVPYLGFIGLVVMHTG